MTRSERELAVLLERLVTAPSEHERRQLAGRVSLAVTVVAMEALAIAADRAAKGARAG